MVQLEVKLRIKHELGSGRRRRTEKGWCRLQGEKDRGRREGEREGRQEGSDSPCSLIRGQNID